MKISSSESTTTEGIEQLGTLWSDMGDSLYYELFGKIFEEGYQDIKHFLFEDSCGCVCVSIFMFFDVL